MRHLSLVAVLGLSACLWGRGSARTALPDPLLVRADAMWDQRDVHGLDEVEAAIAQHVKRRGETPGNLWRLARVRVAEGLRADSDRAALEKYAEGRALGMRCLDLSPGFRQRRVDADLRQALRFIEEVHVPCAAWATLGWARWVHIMGGDAASMDLDDLEGLARHVALVGEVPERSVGLWAQALTHLARPAWAERDDAEAQAMMERAVRVAPDERWRSLDLLVLVALPRDDGALIEQIRARLKTEPRFPEDRVATYRIRQLLDGE